MVLGQTHATPLLPPAARTHLSVATVSSNASAWINPELLERAERICSGYVVPAVCLFGIACNALNLVVLTHRQMRGSPYTYLLGLAVTDVSVLTLSVIESAVSKPFGNGVYFWQVYDAYVFYPVANVFTSSSVWITVLLTVERYISVRYPLKAKELCTSRLARRTIVVVVLLATVINLPRFFCSSIRPRRRPTTFSSSAVHGNYSDGVATVETDTLSRTSIPSNPSSSDIDVDDGEIVGYERTSNDFESGEFFGAWTWFSIAAVHAVPCMTLLYLNAGLVAIVCVASRRRAALRGGIASVGCSHGQQQQQQHPQQRRPVRWNSSSLSPSARWWTSTTGAAAVSGSPQVGAEEDVVRPHHPTHHHSTEQIRMTITCISIICLFLVCIIPSAFSNRPVAKALFGHGQTMDQFTSGSFYRLLRVVTNLLVCGNLSLNFLLYCVFNHRFLHTLRLICCRYWSLMTGRRCGTGSLAPVARTRRTPVGCRGCMCCFGVVGRAGGGDVDNDVIDAAAGATLNRRYRFRMPSSTSGGNSRGAGGGEPLSGNGSSTGGGVTRGPGEFLVVDVDVPDVPVVISIQRGRADYKALRSATGGPLAFQFPMRDRPKTPPNTFD